MYNIDFEATNSNLLSNKMFNGRDSRQINQRRRVVRLVKKPEKRANMKGSNFKEPEGNTLYPKLTNAKIFGMTPKTLGVALGVIVLSIWVLSKTGDSSGQMINNGGAIG